ncbi:MAG: toprim domain-containing protein [Gammaproteobacteria bacterium]|nr:toprim domain-containing protein [Gammaproteobacteria bacterium]
MWEKEFLEICASPSWNSNARRGVETPADLEAIEQAGVYRGKYFVLMGHLSPLDDIGPDQLAIKELLTLISNNKIEEVILATNLTLEGQATSDFLYELLAESPVRITRLARGMPMGSELEYMDPGTLDQAFTNRSSPL